MPKILTIGGVKDGDGVLLVQNKKGNAGLYASAAKGATVKVGATGIAGQLSVMNAKAKATINANGADGALTVGGHKAEGRISVLGADGSPVFEAYGTDEESLIGLGRETQPARLSMFDGEGREAVKLSGASATVAAGGDGVGGTVAVYGADDIPTLFACAEADQSALLVGAANRPAIVSLRGDQGDETVRITAADSTVTVGGATTDGVIAVRDSDYHDAVTITGADATVQIGGATHDGTVSVLGADGAPVFEAFATATESVVGIGQIQRPGRLAMYNGTQQAIARINAADGTFVLGGKDCAASISILGSNDKPSIQLNGGYEASINVGEVNRAGHINVRDSAGNDTIRLNGSDGDIWIANADFAEDFDVDEQAIEAGFVMVLAASGKLAPCTRAYDTRVAGVVSGAGKLRPGLILDRKRTERKRHPLALVGKVYCWVDASGGSIEIGDLLTTGERKGHAMRAGDRDRAFGAVLGKALAPLASGCGLVPILVTLQ